MVELWWSGGLYPVSGVVRLVSFARVASGRANMVRHHRLT